MSAPTVALFLSGLRAGGSERVMTHIANAANEAGASVHLLSLEQDDAQPFFELDCGIHRVPLGVSRNSKTPFHGLLANVHRLRVLRRALAQIRPDTVLAFGTPCCVLASLASSKRWRTIISERLAPGYYAESRLWSAARKVAYRRANLHVAQTRAVAEWSRSNWPQLRTQVVSNPVHLPPKVQPVLQRPKTILHVGRMTREKGHDILIRAFGQFSLSHPEWQLHLVGDGPLRGQLEALARQTESPESIVFHGAQASTSSFFHESRVFVLPSRNEGFPNALLEAMAHGCAVVSSDCPFGPREILEPLPEALFASEDIAELASHLGRLADDLACATRAEASLKVVQAYGHATILPQWLDVLGISRTYGLAVVESLPKVATP